MKRLLPWLMGLLGTTPVRGLMDSRINTVSLALDGRVRKQAGPVFRRGEYCYEPRLLLLREVAFLKRLAGRHVPCVLAEGEDWFEMERCGVELAEDNVPSDWCKQISEIAASLDAAGIVHRDIKPGNVLVKEGRLYLIDFGWAVWANEASYLSPRELCADVPREHVYDNRAALEWVVSLYVK